MSPLLTVTSSTYRTNVFLLAHFSHRSHFVHFKLSLATIKGFSWLFHALETFEITFTTSLISQRWVIILEFEIFVRKIAWKSNFAQNHLMYLSDHLIWYIKFKFDVSTFWVPFFVLKYPELVKLLTFEIHAHITGFGIAKSSFSVFENATFPKVRNFRQHVLTKC